MIEEPIKIMMYIFLKGELRNVENLKDENKEDNMRNFLEIFWPVLVIVLGFCLFLSCLVATINKITVPAEITKIEQLRIDTKDVDIRASEDVLGLVVNTNMKIKSQQYFNTKWWSCLFVPDEWDSIKLIPVR